MTTTRYLDKGWLCIDLKGATLFAGGEVGSVLNPEGHDLIIERAVLYTIAATTTGAATLAIGVAANATTSAADLVAAAAIDGGAGGAVNCTLDSADAKDPLTVWTKDYYITATGSADTAAFDALLFVKYVHADMG